MVSTEVLLQPFCVKYSPVGQEFVPECIPLAQYEAGTVCFARPRLSTLCVEHECREGLHKPNSLKTSKSRENLQARQEAPVVGLLPC